MSNIQAIYDKYSSEDYLCHKLKPKDIPEYVCSHCGCNVDPKDFGLPVCFECGEYLYVTEK